MSKVIFDSDKTTVVEVDNNLMIDTTVDFDRKDYGTSNKVVYIPAEEDVFLKKIPSLKDVNLKRDIKLDKYRHLHTIRKIEAASIKKLCSLLGFDYTVDTSDKRTVLIDKNGIKAIEYTEKSIAIFISDTNTVMADYLKAVPCLLNTRLTGPDMKITSGYVLAKGSKKYADVIKKLSEDPVTEKLENKIKQLEDSADGNARYSLIGTVEFIQENLDDLEETHKKTPSVVSRKHLDSSFQQLEIEMK